MLVRKSSFPHIFTLVGRAEGKRSLQEIRKYEGKLRSKRQIQIQGVGFPFLYVFALIRFARASLQCDSECTLHRGHDPSSKMEGWAAAGTRQSQISVLG